MKPLLQRLSTSLFSPSIFSLSFMCLVMCLVMCQSAQAADTRSLVILHTNDFHGHIKEENGYAGAAKIAGLINHLRRQRDDLLVVDAGDAVSGTPVSTLFRGTPIFEIMSEMGYDLGNLGNHEFDYGYEQIKAFRKAADFPLLSANAMDPGGKLLGDNSSLILKINNVTIGIIGVITETTPDITIPTGNKNIQITSAVAAVRKQLNDLRPNVDLIIVLSHLGLEGDITLAKTVKGINIIVGGHSHTLLQPAMRQEGTGDWSTWIVQAHQYGTHLGKMEITLDTQTDIITSFHSTLISANDMHRNNADVQKIVTRWEKKVEEEVDFEIARSAKTISGDELRQLIENVMIETSQVKFAYYNKGGIRDIIPKGKVTARHIWNLEPFGNTLVTLRIKGKQIKQILLREKETRPDLQKLDDGEEILLATNNFIAAHAFKSFGQSIVISDTDIPIRDMLINHIRKDGLQANQKE